MAVAVLASSLAYLAHLVRSLETPEFQRAVLDRISAAVGALEDRGDESGLRKLLRRRFL